MNLIAFVFILLWSLQPAKAYSVMCMDIVGHEAQKQTPLKLSLRDRGLLFKSKMSPVHESENFDLRIVHNKENKNLEIRPTEIRRSVLKSMNKALAFFSENSLQPRSFVHVVAEANQGGLKYVLSLNGVEPSNGNFVSHIPDQQGPYAASAFNSGLVVPSFLGREMHLKFDLGPESFETVSVVMVLPALDGLQFASLQDFIIAHEYAHITESIFLRNVPLWQETRADLIAYLVTGETAFEFPNFGEVGGAAKIIEGSRGRNLDVLELRSVDKHFAPELYHLNSEILSQFLFKVQKSIERPVLLDFIKWFDESLGLAEDPSISMIINSSQNPSQQIFGIVRAFGAWAATQELSVEELFEVNRLITLVEAR